jgi:hypothetical protein
MERTLVDACRRLTSTAVELNPDIADIDMTPLPREYGEQGLESNGNCTTVVATTKHHRIHRRSNAHSYQDISVDQDSDVELHKRIDHLSRLLQ